jgi:hypothetical protein
LKRDDETNGWQYANAGRGEILGSRKTHEILSIQQAEDFAHAGLGGEFQIGKLAGESLVKITDRQYHFGGARPAFAHLAVKIIPEGEGDHRFIEAQLAQETRRLGQGYYHPLFAQPDNLEAKEGRPFLNDLRAVLAPVVDISVFFAEN